MAIASLVARVAALVAFSDNSLKQVLASRDEKGLISVNDDAEHADTMLHTDQDTVVIDTFGDLFEGATVTLAPTASAVAAPKTVNDLVVEVSGRISNNNVTRGSESWGDFAVQFQNISGVSSWRAVGGDVANFVAAVQDTTMLAALQALFLRAGLTLSVS